MSKSGYARAYITKRLRNCDAGNSINRVDSGRLNLAVPYPGTALSEIAVQEGLQVTDDWSNINTAAGLSDTQAFNVPKGRTMEELAKLQQKAHIEFYLRPKQIRRTLRRENIDFNLPEITSLRQFFELLGAIGEFMFHSVKK